MIKYETVLKNVLENAHLLATEKVRIEDSAGRRHFVLVTIYRKNGCYHLMPVLSHGSADILALAAADGFMVLNENAGKMFTKSIEIQGIYLIEKRGGKSGAYIRRGRR